MKLTIEIIVLLKDIIRLLKDIKMMLIREPYRYYVYPYFDTFDTTDNFNDNEILSDILEKHKDAWKKLANL